MSSSQPILICTVGGSHAPIVTSICKHRPQHVWFVCTEGKAGSIRQITDEGNCIKKSPSDKDPSLPNIPTQAGLSKEAFSTRIVVPDDPDAIHQELRELLCEITKEHPDVPIIADYTGGTKSMTGALILTALEFDDVVSLFVVAGQRMNLMQVTDGTEIPVRANVDRIRFLQKHSVALAPWKYYGYAEAAVALDSMNAPSEETDRNNYLAALAASRAFAAWDRFDHAEARRLLKPLGAQFGEYLAVLSQLTLSQAQQSPTQLLDLHLNLQRRATRRLFDDAVARAYRLLEWTAQWLLERDAGIDTSDIDEQQIPAGMTLRKNQRGKYNAGLRDAWTMLKSLGNSETSAFADENSKLMLNLLDHRNQSILAHGVKPVSESDWDDWEKWLSGSFLPFLIAEAKRSGIREEPKQLPTQFPEFGS